MNTELLISRDTTKPADDKGAYHTRVSYAETDNPCHGLRQVGPVENDIIHYRAVCATRDEAEALARDYQFPRHS